jgi:hypothetical protein
VLVWASRPNKFLENDFIGRVAAREVRDREDAIARHARGVRYPESVRARGDNCAGYRELHSSE